MSFHNLVRKAKNFIRNQWEYILLGVAIIFCTFVAVSAFKSVYNELRGQNFQLQELYDNDVFLLNLTKFIAVYQQAFNEAVVKDLTNIVKKPSYDYLTSVTLFMFQPLKANSKVSDALYEMTDDDNGKRKGYVGTAVVVAEQDGYFYILTNKHICNKDTEECYAIMGEKKSVRLEFVKQTESAYDLALWRTESKNLDGKRAVVGFNIAYPQDNIYSVGQYLGYPFVYTEGTVGGYEVVEDENGNIIKAVIENMSCTHGCSGSGVFNKDGELVGLNFAGNILGFFQEETAKILAIDGDVIQLFLKDLINE